jgi:hypothetical protein
MMTIYNLFVESLVRIDAIKHTENEEKNCTSKSNYQNVNKQLNKSFALPVLTEILDANIRPPMTASAVHIACPITTPAVTIYTF